MVGGYVAFDVEGGVVGSDVGDVTVFEIAEFWVAIAGLCVRWSSRGGGG